MNDIQCTTYQGNEIRFFLGDNNIFWFAAGDIEYILGYRYGATTCIRRLHENFITHRSIKDSFKIHPVRFVNEQGVVIALKLPIKTYAMRRNAEAFRNAFVNEILPALRMAYIHDTPDETSEAQLQIFEQDRNCVHIDVSVPRDTFDEVSAFASLTGQDVAQVITGLSLAFVSKHHQHFQLALENKKVLDAIKDDYMKGVFHFER